ASGRERRRTCSFARPRRGGLAAGARNVRPAGDAVVDLRADHELLELDAVLVDLARLVEVDVPEQRERPEPAPEIGHRLLVRAEARQLPRPARVGAIGGP